MRHSDPDFARLLNVMRMQQPTQELLDEVLGQCLLPEADVTAMLANPDATIFCACKDLVHQYNHDILHSRFAASHIHNIPVIGTATSVPELADWLNDTDFHTLPEVTIGAHVMLLKNIDVEHCLANGVMATVVSFGHHKDGALDCIVIKITQTVEEEHSL